MQKGKRIVVYLLTALLLFGGCNSQNDLYEIIEKDGKYYISFFEEEENVQRSDGMCEVRASVKFQSMEEMVSDIKNGNFTQEEIAAIRKFPANETGEILLCNIEKMYEPICPADVNMCISWSGAYYSFYAGSKNGSIRCSYHLITQSDFEDRLYISYYNHPVGNSWRTVSVENDADRNAVIYNKENDDGEKMKWVAYSINSAAKNLYIVECYKENDGGYLELNDIDIFGEENNQYFDIFIWELSARPTVEWLSQFGVREYVETSVF